VVVDGRVSKRVSFKRTASNRAAALSASMAVGLVRRGAEAGVDIEAAEKLLAVPIFVAEACTFRDRSAHGLVAADPRLQAVLNGGRFVEHAVQLVDVGQLGSVDTGVSHGGDAVHFCR
jgi:hypothetical protein